MHAQHELARAGNTVKRFPERGDELRIESLDLRIFAQGLECFFSGGVRPETLALRASQRLSRRDSVSPRPEPAWISQRRQAAANCVKSLLKDVLGEKLVTGNSPDVVEQLPAYRREKLLECLTIT